MSVLDEIKTIFKNAVPQDVMASELGVLLVDAICSALAEICTKADEYVADSRIRSSTGPALVQHARDRGTNLQDGETESQLKERLKKPPSAVTLTAIRFAVEAIVGPSGPVIIIELPKNSLYFDRAGDPLYQVEEQYALLLNRGRRCGGGRGVVIALIPVQSNAVQSVVAAMRSKVAAGKIQFTQTYLTAATIPRSAIYYPPTPAIMRIALGESIDNGVWTAGFLFSEETAPFQSSQKFGDFSLSDRQAEIRRVLGRRTDHSAIKLVDDSRQKLISNSGIGPVGVEFKLCALLKIDTISYVVRSIFSYGDDSRYIRVDHYGTGSLSPAPNTLRVTCFDGANSVSVDAIVPDNEWLVFFAGNDELNTTLFCAYAAGSSSGGPYTADSSSLISLAATDDTLKIGSALNTTTESVAVDALWWSGSSITFSDAQTACQNLYTFVSR